MKKGGYMKVFFNFMAVIVLGTSFFYAQESISQTAPVISTPGSAVSQAANPATSGSAQVPVIKPAIILLISEQNIESPQHAWWASEVDLSATEAKIAGKLLEQGYTILDPSQLTSRIAQKPAFRVLAISQEDSVALGNLSKADYVVLGKAVASAGPNVPDSRMRSCFANITAKIIRVKDNKVISYLEASGNSAHLDVITGGKEALVRAAENVSTQLIAAMNKEGGL